MKIELSNKALACLKSVLCLPEWVKHDDPAVSIKRSYWANKLIAHMPETTKFPAPPTKQDEVADYEKAMEAWAVKKTKSFDANAAQVDACKTALTHSISKGIVNNGPHLSELFDVFKVYEEPKE